MTLPVFLPLVLVLVVLIGVVLLATANRLDRLHIRTDAAYAGLLAALARRSVVARTAGAGLRELADAAEYAARPRRPAAEEALTMALAELDRAELRTEVAVELADAEARVVYALRVYNDAVRDTRALRARLPVRLLRLAGTAALPEYFEITEPVVDAPAARFAGEHGQN